MNKAIDSDKWLARNFFFISTGIFIIIYLRWFQLTPLELDGSYNDPNEAYITGVILLGIYILSTNFVGLARNRRLLKTFVSILTFLLLGINIIHAFFFLPRLTAAVRCNGKSYYISSNFGTPTNFWSYDQLTIWENNLGFKSSFFGYGNESYQFICDEVQNEVNIIIPYLEYLDSTYGEYSRHYLHGNAKLGDQRFFISEDWVLPEGCNKDGEYSHCDIYIYTLYKCNLDYKSCEALPIQYTSDYDEHIALELETDGIANEITLFDDYSENPDRALIFTYGEHPRCYVEGCEILEEAK